MKQIVLSLSFTLMSGAAMADCPAAPDHNTRLSHLTDLMREAPSEQLTNFYTNLMWGYWIDAPDETAQILLNRGLEKRALGDLRGARQSLDMLIGYCPQFAEGYAQRAYLHFMVADYQSALNDAEYALALSPNHLDAKASKGVALVANGYAEQGRAVLDEVLAVNPWLEFQSVLDTLLGSPV